MVTNELDEPAQSHAINKLQATRKNYARRFTVAANIAEYAI